MNRLHLAFGLIVFSLASTAAPGRAAECSLDYPFVSDEPRTNVPFEEAEVLRGFSPAQTVAATPGTSIKVWYNDEHALLLGVRQVQVKTRFGTTVTEYPVSAMTANPAAASNPEVGTTALAGDQAGTDTAACGEAVDHCARPLFPALFLTDITADGASRAGDWQYGGTPIPPHAVFGTWKAAVRIVDETKTPPRVSIVPDGNPVKNHWDLGDGDPAPAGLADEGYGAEVRWSVDQLIAAGEMVLGHAYRVQFMVHDGDQGRRGGDVGEGCVNLTLPACVTAEDCDDGNSCTTERCDGGVCGEMAIADCTPCATAADCDDGSGCTTDGCEGGTCTHAFEESCVPCSTAADCGVDDDPCSTASCVAGVCRTLHRFDCPRPLEICGDCIDNDGDGLTDFEDPACCSAVSGIVRLRGRLVPGAAGASRLRLQTQLASTGGETIDPLAEDVFLQVRAEDGRRDLLCARVPATKFMRMHRAYQFWDKAQAVASAQGLHDMTIKLGPRGRIRLRTHGPRVRMLDAAHGRLRVTVATYGAGEGESQNACWASMVPFRATRRGKLVTP